MEREDCLRRPDARDSFDTHADVAGELPGQSGDGARMPTTGKSPRASDVAPEGRRGEIIAIVAAALARLIHTDRAPAIPCPDTPANIPP